MRKIKLFIAGEWCDGEDGKLLDVINPATEEIVAQLSLAGPQDLERVLEAAAKGFATWRQLGAKERGSLINDAANRMRKKIDSIALVLTEEQGKTLQQSKAEVSTTADYFDELARCAVELSEQIIPEPNLNLRRVIAYEPVGPTFAVAPWNLPAMLPGRKLATALAAGCSVIIKPAKETPETTYLIARCCQEAGIPEGVVNVINGPSELISQAMIDSSAIRKISFTGSTPVGKLLASQASAAMKKITMELGGHAPCIICNDVDVEDVVSQLVPARYGNAGQSCIAPTRFFVHVDIYEAFLSQFSEVTSKLRVGNGLDSGVDMGPLASERRVSVMEELVDDAVSRGAQLRAGGHRISTAGYFFEPTVLSDVPDDATIMNEEPFGPVTPITSFDNDADVIRRANQTDYGLAAYIYSNDAGRAKTLANAIEAGLVGANATFVASPKVPFGGVKDSGTGREGAMQGLLESMVTKTTTFAT